MDAYLTGHDLGATFVTCASHANVSREDITFTVNCLNGNVCVTNMCDEGCPEVMTSQMSIHT